MIESMPGYNLLLENLKLIQIVRPRRLSRKTDLGEVDQKSLYYMQATILYIEF